MKLLYDTITKTLLSWPRVDDEPIVGLEPHLLEMDVVQQEPPSYNNDSERLQTTEVIDIVARQVIRGWSVIALPIYAMTAQEWLDSSGYDAMRLVALSDVERQLVAANKTSSAMQAARQWINQVLAMYVADPLPKSGWPTPPADFLTTITDALNVLTAP